LRQYGDTREKEQTEQQGAKKSTYHQHWVLRLQISKKYQCHTQKIDQLVILVDILQKNTEVRLKVASYRFPVASNTE
jgi:hypothetical protein